MKLVLKIGLMAFGAYLGYVSLINPGLDPWLYVSIAGGACFGAGAAIQ